MEAKTNERIVKELRYDFTPAEIEQFKKELYNELIAAGARIEDAKAEVASDNYNCWCAIMSFNTPQSYADMCLM